MLQRGLRGAAKLVDLTIRSVLMNSYNVYNRMAISFRHTPQAGDRKGRLNGPEKISHCNRYIA